MSSSPSKPILWIFGPQRSARSSPESNPLSPPASTMKLVQRWTTGSKSYYRMLRGTSSISSEPCWCVPVLAWSPSFKLDYMLGKGTRDIGIWNKCPQKLQEHGHRDSHTVQNTDLQTAFMNRAVNPFTSACLGKHIASDLSSMTPL